MQKVQKEDFIIKRWGKSLTHTQKKTVSINETTFWKLCFSKPLKIPYVHKKK